MLIAAYVKIEISRLWALAGRRGGAFLKTALLAFPVQLLCGRGGSVNYGEIPPDLTRYEWCCSTAINRRASSQSRESKGAASAIASVTVGNFIDGKHIKFDDKKSNLSFAELS